MNSQKKRNKALLLLANSLKERSDFTSLEFLGELVLEDTPAMKQSYLLMTTECRGSIISPLKEKIREKLDKELEQDEQ